MAKTKDLTGQKFRKLTVIKEALKRSNGHVFWKCQCECGNITTVRDDILRYGKTKSCGCLKKETAAINGKMQMVENTRLPELKKKKANRNSKSSVRGVFFCKREKRWSASLMVNGKKHRLGYFADKQDAINARKEAEEKYFKPILEKYDHTKKPTSVAPEVRQ